MAKYLQFLKISFLDLFEYRMNFVWEVGGVLVSTLIVYAFWVAVIGSGFTKSGYTAVSIGTYYLTITLVGQLTRATFGNLSSAIKEGYIATEVIKPYSLPLKIFFISAGDRIVKSTLTLVIIFALVIAGLRLNSQAHQIGLFALSVILAGLCKHFIGLAINSLAFWFSRIHGFNALFWNIGSLFSGELIPVSFLPSALLGVSAFLPFQYLAYFPTQLLTTSLPTPEVLTGLSLQLLWVVIFYFISKFFWTRGLKSLESIGG